MSAADPASAGARLSGAILLAILLAVSVAAFAATRAVRAQEDIVNTVVLAPDVTPGAPGSGGEAMISFELTEPEPRADVLIIDEGDRQVRALALGVPLRDGPQRYRWDGTTDDGGAAAPGTYALEVDLGEQGREIRPPGRIRVLPQPGEPPAGAGGG